MRNAYELDGKHADVDDVARLYAMQQYVAEQVVFFEFAFGQAGSEMGAVNRNVELLQQIRQRTQVVLVTVGEDNGSDVVAVLVEKTKVGNRNINAVSRFLWKAHSGVENQHLVA